MGNGNARDGNWEAALERAGVDPEADVATLRGRIERLGLLHTVSPPNGKATESYYAIVWSGWWPRDPEVPFGEATSDGTPSRALAEALGRFLVKDPGYPLR